MEILNYIDHHWLFISAVCFPAFLGYLNGFVAACKVMGWTKLADELGKLEDALTVFVQTVRTQKNDTTKGA